MNYNWWIINGWAGFLRPHLLPYWIAISFLYSSCVVRLAFGVYKIKKEDYLLFKVSLCVFVISFCFFVFQSALSYVFTTLMRFYGPYDGYARKWGSYGMSIYQHFGFFVFTLLTVCICSFLTYKVNSQVTAKLINNINENKIKALLFISIFTSPLVFLLSLKEVMQTLFPIWW